MHILYMNNFLPRSECIKSYRRILAGNQFPKGAHRSHHDVTLIAIDAFLRFLSQKL